MSAPGKLVRSSRWKTGPSNGQRPLGSECCVTAGDSGDEAYTAIAWGVGLSLAWSTLGTNRVIKRPGLNRVRLSESCSPACDLESAVPANPRRDADARESHACHCTNPPPILAEIGHAT
jgi:hypothetical protein